MSAPDAAEILPLASEDGEPTFAQPWQAQVLALAFALVEQGVLSPAAWSEALGAELRRTAAKGAPDDQETYYGAALAALEQLVTSADGITADALSTRLEQWRRAYRRTPHGQPVELAAGAKARR